MKDYTEIVFILDRSGSMAGLEADTIGGFNAVLEKNKKQKGNAIVSTVLFDGQVDVICDRKDIDDVRPITEGEYNVRGCTALLDAVGGGIEHISKVQKALPKHHRAKNVLFVITTDGYENASCRYTYEAVRRLIEKKRKKGWEFVFMGANIDAAAEAARMGMAQECAVPYIADGKGTGVAYKAMAAATCTLRECGSLGGSWRDALDEDVAVRG